MGAGGADLRRLFADHDVTAVAAFPDLDLTLLEDRGGLDVFQKRAIALLVVLLDRGDQTELLGKLRKALFLGGFRISTPRARSFSARAVSGL